MEAISHPAGARTEKSRLRKPSPLVAWQAVALVGLLLVSLHVGVGLGGSGTDHFFNRWLYSGLLLLAAGATLARGLAVREKRGAWLVLGGGLTSWAIGDIYYTFAFANDTSPPFPSLADGFYLAFYPAAYVALVLLVRARVREFPRAVWWDGVLATLAASALGATVLVQTVLGATEGSTAVVATNLAYPIGDTLLLALAVGVFALTGWRPGRHWAFIGVALIASAIADGIFLFQIAEGSYREGTLLDVLWPASMLLLAQAAWYRPSRISPIRLEGLRVLVAPAVCGILPVGVLLYAHFRPLNLFALVTAALTLLGVVARAGVTFFENQRILSRIRLLADHDALTGLGNRRKLFADLSEALAAEDGTRRILAVFDLDGFKTYNDCFGHPAGDVLLARLADKLAGVVEGAGSAYRLGGDEFCILAPAGRGGPELLEAARTALSEQGEGFRVEASFGSVDLPDEAPRAAQALGLADQRLYAHKRQRTAGRAPSHDVLLQALHERRPDMEARSRAVAALAESVGRQLGLDAAELETLRRAADLQDIGAIAIPDDVLQKAEALDVVEQAFIRRHAEVGERILSAAPELRAVAAIVRSTHERWDGAGCPDHLAGEVIPLPARIISACDAFVALTESRPYRPAGTDADALAELRLSAGTQFDPAVVDAVCKVAAGEATADPIAAHS
jgi:diguanylate cyclase (GGDEF)-like protein